MPEPLLTGEALFKSTADLAAIVPDGYEVKPWESLSWQEQDEWQDRADELNEARRDPYDA